MTNPTSIFTVLDLVSRSPIKDHTTCYVLFEIARMTSLDGKFECWPSQDELAERLMVTRKTISRHLKKLTEMGFISRTKRYCKSDLITLNIDKLHAHARDLRDTEYSSTHSSRDTGVTLTSKVDGTRGLHQLGVNGTQGLHQLGVNGYSESPRNYPIDNKYINNSPEVESDGVDYISPSDHFEVGGTSPPSGNLFSPPDYDSIFPRPDRRDLFDEICQVAGVDLPYVEKMFSSFLEYVSEKHDAKYPVQTPASLTKGFRTWWASRNHSGGKSSGGENQHAHKRGPQFDKYEQMRIARLAKEVQQKEAERKKLGPRGLHKIKTRERQVCRMKND